jgi:hypothetical protein
MQRLVCLWLVGCPALVFGQFNYVIEQTVPVTDQSNIPYEIPWAGGLNAAHYNSIDLNQDGAEDLLLFDRMAGKPVPFLNDNGRYRYAPEYETQFPEMANWVLLRDFNCDGRKDIFTGDVLGIRVFLNTTATNGPLRWEPHLFFSQSGAPKSQVLLTKGFSGLINLQLQFDDLPSITDMDNDGDLDILSMNFLGDGAVELHKNFSQERYGSCDSLEFERITQSWGDFKECECGHFAFNGENCPPHGPDRTKHSNGKALLVYDFDNDLDQDLLFSDGECTVLYLLENTGSADSPTFSSAIDFPPGDPASFHLFPTPFLEDVDFDGRRDLIVIPNVFTKDHLDINLKESNWFYRNAGTENVPDYVPVSRSYLQGQMIDVGDNAVPAFTDADGDGDLDMIIGQDNNGSESTGSIALYENTGNPGAPSFRLVTDNYLDFESHEFYNIKPQFHDANGDGRTDLIFSATSAATHQTALYTLLNKNNSGLDFSGQPLTMVSFDMLFTENVHMVDVDLDGLPDILAGKSNGSVQFWKNSGPQGVINLSLETSEFQGFGPSVERQSMAMSVADLDADARADLVIGDQYGQLGVISDFRQTSQEISVRTDLIYNSISGEYETRNLGGRIWPTVSNLFDERRPAIVVGNILGGIHILRNDGDNTLPDEPLIEIYPNPVVHEELLNFRIDRPATLQLISLLGQELTAPVTVLPNQYHRLPLPAVSSGIYILRISVANKNYSRRLVIF